MQQLSQKHYFTYMIYNCQWTRESLLAHRAGGQFPLNTKIHETQPKKQKPFSLVYHKNSCYVIL